MEGHEEMSFPMTKEMKQRIKALTRLQNEHESITQDFEKEVRELERKYLARYQPLYETRAAIVSGEKEPTGEEGQADSDEEEEEESGDDEGALPAKGLPAFWLRALGNCAMTAQAITEEDLPILEHLQDIKLEYLPADEEGYTLEFVFSENPYFSHKSLKKVYRAQTGPEFEGQPLVMVGEGMEIKWSEGKDPTCTITKKKQKNKKTGQVRVVTKKEKKDSFFNFFNPPELPDLSEIEDVSEMPEGFAELAEEAQFDLELGEVIKEKIIPEAVLYFLGIADDSDDEDEEFDEEDYDEDDDEDDDDEDDDEDEDADAAAAKGPQENPPECKQQ